MLATLAVVLAACADNQSSGPATANVATPTTNSDVDSTDSTLGSTAAPATTLEASSATATSTTDPAPTTTELPGPKDPTGRTVAVFAATPGGVDRGWVPLGGWTGTAFVNAAKGNAPKWTQGRDIRVSTLSGAPIGSQIGADRSSCSGDPGPRIRVPVSAGAPSRSGFAAVAVEGTWPLRPRPVVDVEARIPRYEDAARDLLGRRVPESRKGHLAQIVLADMNANEAETSFIVYESTPVTAPDGSGFSILFAVDNNSGRAFEIESDVVDPPPEPEQGEPASGTNTTSTTTTTVPVPALERFRVLDVIDLNGDRIMELLTKSWSDDEITVGIHEVDGRSLRRVGGASCDR